MRIDISISIRPFNTKFGKQVHVEVLNQIRLIKQGLVTSSLQDHLTLKKCYDFPSARAMIIQFEQSNYEETRIN